MRLYSLFASLLAVLSVSLPAWSSLTLNASGPVWCAGDLLPEALFVSFLSQTFNSEA